MDPNPPSEIGQSSGSEFMSLRHPSAFDQVRVDTRILLRLC